MKDFIEVQALTIVVIVTVVHILDIVVSEVGYESVVYRLGLTHRTNRKLILFDWNYS